MTDTLTADLCILSGRVFDGRIRTADTAIAIAAGRIVAIGDDERIRDFAGDRTQILDARGGLILPGFVDAHAHAAFAGVERLSCDLTPARTVEETFTLVAEAAAASDAEWVTGGGWSHELFEAPTREMLDAIVPDRPIALSDAGHHTLWVNSLALQRAGLDRNTPDPPNGRIHRDADGEPTGYLNETAAELVGRVIPAASDAEIVAGLRNAQEHLWSIGVTGWHEAILGEYNGKADCTSAYHATIADGSLRSRVSGALWVAPGLTPEAVPPLVERFVALRKANAEAGFDTSTAKVMVDGGPARAVLSARRAARHRRAAHLRGGARGARRRPGRGGLRDAPAHHGRPRCSCRLGRRRDGAPYERSGSTPSLRAPVDGAPR